MNYKHLLSKLLEGEPDGQAPAAPAADPAPAEPAAAPTPELSALLGSEYQEAASLQDFKSVDALAKGYMDLKQYQGSSLRIPGEDASAESRQEFNQRLIDDVPGVMLRPDFTVPEQAAEFYKSMGAPNEADGYQYTAPEGAGDFKTDDARISMFKDIALQNGLTKSQFSNIMNEIVASDVKDSTAMAAKAEEGMVSLRQEWGHAYDQNTQVAINIAKATGAPPGMQDALLSGNVGPDTMKWLHSLASKFGAEGQNLINKDPAVYKSTPAEIQDQISDIMGNRDHPYWVAGHPEHDQAVQKMLGLQRTLHGA